MKKRFLLAFSIPFILFSCRPSNIDTPKSPFDDHYERIGVNSEYNVVNPLGDGELDDINASIYPEEGEPTDVSHFKHQIETRDLKYAYFGEESSTISQCSLLSQVEDSNRYSNNVSIDINESEQQIQTANAGVIKTDSTITDYTFDTDYNKTILSGEYRQTRQTIKKGEEPGLPTVVTDTTDYSDEELIFGLKPLAKIKSHFAFDDKFSLLGPNAVYGTIEDGSYLIKEGYSVFKDFTTTMGRSYKAEDNYFYEGLLEKVENDDNVYHFKYFRFYHELLILSKAFDGTGVPVLYLDKPVLIEFSEDKYWIDYNKNLEKYSGVIPDLPSAQE